MKTYQLHFEGSILDDNRNALPTYSGVYLVYKGTLSPDKKMLNCFEIMYIGQAEDIRKRHQDHDKRKQFLERLLEGEVLFYSFAKVDSPDLNRVEAALIYDMKPILNDKGKDFFPYPDTEILSDGACALLNQSIKVETTI